MHFSWKGLGIAIGLAILILSNILAGLYVFANIIDWKIDVLNINPSEPSNDRNFPVMTYPPSNGSGFQIRDSKNTIVFENMYLRYNGTAAENQPLELSAIGTLDPSFAEKIMDVSLYFDGALPYPVTNGYGYTGGWGISLFPTIEDQNVGIRMGAYLVGYPAVINWQVQGDYYPSISIHFKNFTDVTQSYVSYQDFRMHIDSADVLRQQNASRINTSVSIASAFFGFVDGSVLIGRFLLTKKKKRTRKPKPSELGKTKDDGEE